MEKCCGKARICGHACDMILDCTERDRAYQSICFFSNYTAVNVSFVWHLQKAYFMCSQTPPVARCTLLMSMPCPFFSFIDQHVCANYVFSNTIGAALESRLQTTCCKMSMPIAYFSLSNTNTSVLKHLGMSNCAQY